MKDRYAPTKFVFRGRQIPREQFDRWLAERLVHEADLAVFSADPNGEVLEVRRYDAG